MKPIAPAYRVRSATNEQIETLKQMGCKNTALAYSYGEAARLIARYAAEATSGAETQEPAGLSPVGSLITKES